MNTTSILLIVIMCLVVLNIAQFLFIIFTEKMHYRERKDLYNRLMVRNANEYKILNEDKTLKEKSKPVNLARNEIETLEHSRYVK